MSLLENDLQKMVRWEASQQLVKAKFAGFLGVDDFKQMANETLVRVTEYQGKRILVDLVDFGVMPQESQKFIQEEWFPKAVAAGVQKMAFLVPKNVFADTSTRRTNRDMETRGAIQIQYFGDQGEAESWLNAEA